MGNAGCEMWGHVTGHPQHRAPGVQRGVGLAAEEEGGRRRVHRQREVEELLDAGDEEVEERAVLEPLLPELLLERRQHRLELLWLEEAGDLAGREQRVDRLDHRRVAEHVVLEQQARRRPRHARLRQRDLELGAERSEGVVAHHRRRHELEAVEMAREREQRAAADARRADEEEVAAGAREHAVHCDDVAERLREEEEAELLHLQTWGMWGMRGVRSGVT